MKLGILQCDNTPSELFERFGHYPELFKILFNKIDPDLRYEIYEAHNQRLPETTRACDAYIITGSRYGVYESHPWLTHLESFIARLNQERRKLVGICFGHQLMAQITGDLSST